MSSLIIPPSVAMERAMTKVVQKKLEEQETRLRDQFQVTLAQERRYGDVGRAVMQALNKKGVPVGGYSSPAAGVDEVCAKYAAMGKDFDTLMTAIKNDVMLNSEWERFCMMLRLAQEDNTDGT